MFAVPIGADSDFWWREESHRPRQRRGSFWHFTLIGRSTASDGYDIRRSQLVEFFVHLSMRVCGAARAKWMASLILVHTFLSSPNLQDCLVLLLHMFIEHSLFLRPCSRIVTRYILQWQAILWTIVAVACYILHPARQN